MPLYEYQCDSCAHRFEVIQRFSDPPIAICPKCGAQVQKLPSAPAIQFKGSGWYVTDYAKKSGSDSDKNSSDSGKSSGDKDKESSSSDKDKDSKTSSTTATDSKSNSTTEKSSPSTASPSAGSTSSSSGSSDKPS